MKNTRAKLAKHYYELGQLDHPYVKEFSKELDVKEEDVKKVEKMKDEEKKALERHRAEIAKKKAEADAALKVAQKAKKEAENAAKSLPKFEVEEDG